MFERKATVHCVAGWLCHVLCSHDDLNPLATNDSESWRIIIYAILMHITLYMNMNWLRHGAATAVPSFRQHVKRDLKRDWFYDANFRNGFVICFFLLQIHTTFLGSICLLPICCKYMQLFPTSIFKNGNRVDKHRQMKTKHRDFHFFVFVFPLFVLRFSKFRLKGLILCLRLSFSIVWFHFRILIPLFRIVYFIFRFLYSIFRFFIPFSECFISFVRLFDYIFRFFIPFSDFIFHFFEFPKTQQSVSSVS